MKTVILAALLAIGATTAANAQTSLRILNNNSCAFQIRAVCIDEATCTDVPDPAGWFNIPSGISTYTFGHPGCPAPTVMGFEIRYDPSTGCSAPSVYFTTNTATPTPCPAYQPIHTRLDPCPCNTNGGNGVDLDYLQLANDLHIQP